MIRCYNCLGHGIINLITNEKCPKCKGTGIHCDPLRTYDAWSKDKNGKPQTWEEYLTKK